MSQQRRHPIRQVGGKSACREWGKSGKLYDGRRARRLTKVAVRDGTI